VAGSSIVGFPQKEGRREHLDLASIPAIGGAEANFYWYVTFMCAIALVASILMPDPKVKGYLQGTGTEL
jgi:hypothetical protein